MTLDEMRDQKDDTERYISEALNDFAKATGLRIDSISMHTMDTTNIGSVRPECYYDVELEIKL